MKSLATSRFWRQYKQLPESIRRLADKSFRLWQRNPAHPSLHFKKLKGSRTLHSVRIGIHYRALGNLEGDTIRWLWIGTHAEYDLLAAGREG